MQRFIVIVIILHVICCNGEKEFYTAAIVEYSPEIKDTPFNTIHNNLIYYRQYAEIAYSKNVDIIVFPEYGLTTFIDPEGYAIDFSNNSTILQTLSNLAKELNLYLVVNLLEKVQEDSKTLYYNTNLVYNRQGEVVVKYRKINLYGEPKLARGTETITFSTDFGVTFGIFTCMDILYNYPSRSILQSNITDIIFPTAWFSTMPFYTALTVQSGYFLANGINLLTANYNQPKLGHGGSGIYAADENSVEMYIGATSSSKIIIRNVKKLSKKQKPMTCQNPTTSHGGSTIQQQDMSDYITYRDFIAKDYVFKTIDLLQTEISTTICYGKFCCNFTMSVAQPSREVYKLMAYDGEVIYDQSTAHIRVCSLLACQNGSDESCGVRINGTTQFTKIAVDGVMEKNYTTFYTPLTLNYNLRPILESSYCSNLYSNGTLYVRLDTSQPQQAVLVFGIFGRVESIPTL